MNQKTLLIEIQTEDLPSKELKNITQAFYSFFKQALKKNQITYQSILLFYTTKKITLKILSLIYIKKFNYIRKLGPLVTNPLKEKDQIKHSIKNWLKLHNITLQQTEKIFIKNKQYFSYYKKIKSVSLKKVLIKVIPEIIKKIPFKKSMLWNINNIRFARPIRNIMVLLNNKKIKLNLNGIKSENISYGHFLMSPKKIIFYNADQYTEELFKKKYIIINYHQRKKTIKNQIKKLAKSINKLLKINKKLLNEIAISTEWPKAYIGKFKKKYLKIPKNIIKYIIENNQKYFSLYDNETNNITNSFIFISNIETDNSKKIIRENEQVLHSKFSNIIFFLKQDQKISLIDRTILLKKISFQKQLGSMYDKTLRIKKLSQYISNIINANVQLTKRAAILSKCDLTTSIITECSDLQGIIGMYYAQQNKENEKVALAIREHYLPNFSKSKLPTQKISYALSIADKIDTIIGIFRIDKKPKKNKDPFALRRAAIGIIRIIIKKKISINLHDLIIKSINLYQKNKENKKIITCILKFIFSKYQSWCLKKKINKKIILSVLSLQFTNLIDINKRVIALNTFYKKNKINNILNIYKRINNILVNKKKNKTIKVDLFSSKNIQTFSLYEQKLIYLIIKIRKKIYQKKTTNYSSLLKNFQELCIPIEKFFQNSLIYHKNIQKRSYRVLILKKIKKIFLYLTDFSYL